MQSFMESLFLKIELDEDKSRYLSNASIMVTNTGTQPATKVVIKIESGGNILNYGIFSIDEVSLTKINPKILEARMARFVQGSNIIIKMNTTIDANSYNKSYNVHAVYDQGFNRLNERLPWYQEFAAYVVSDLTFKVVVVVEAAILGFILFVAYRKNYENSHKSEFFIDAVIREMITVRNMLMCSNLESTELTELIYYNSGYKYGSSLFSTISMRDFLCIDNFYETLKDRNEYIKKISYMDPPSSQVNTY